MSDASVVVSAALRETSIPGLALVAARKTDVIAISAEVFGEIAAVLERPRFANAISASRRLRILESLAREAVWFTPSERVTECRDAKDDKYLELAAASQARIIVTGDADLLVLDP